MQLNFALLLADTAQISAESLGAYVLLLGGCWQAGGAIKNDPEELARRARMSPRQWKRVAPSVLQFFTENNGLLSQKRLTAELERARGKSVVRAEAGRLGGHSRASKSQAIASQMPKQNESIATILPKHLKDSKILESASQPLVAGQLPSHEALSQALLVAVGLGDARAERHPGLIVTGQMMEFLKRGYSLQDDLVACIADHHARKPAFKPRDWSYYAEMIVEWRQRREAIPQAAALAVEDWPGRLAVFAEGTWAPAWGPKPGEPGCRVPPELLTPK